MIEFRIGYIGKPDDVIYQRAVEYFKEKNSDDKDFNIVFEDITNMSTDEIDAKTFHMTIFDINSMDDNMKRVLQELKNTRSDISDINIFPYAREAITKSEIEKNNEKLSSILETDDLNIIPINVSDQIDIKGYLDAIGIASRKYEDRADELSETRDEIQNKLVEETLKAAKSKDNVTYEHIVSVGKMTEEFAKFLQYDEDTVKSMKHVALLHDTGKIAIPSKVLKAGLTLGNEVQQMNPHDELGVNILKNTNALTEEEKKGVDGHHGKEAGHDNEYSYLITLVDSFDAMTSQRGYNCPKNIVEALEDVMRNSGEGKQFRNKDMAKNFILYNIVELGKMGYDVKAMFENFMPDKESVQEILDICEQHKNEIVIENPPTKEVTSLGYTLDENGRLNYVDKEQKQSLDIRRNSEFEFKVKSLYSKSTNPREIEVFKNAKNINELIEDYLKTQNVSSKEESQFWKDSVDRINFLDNRGKKLIDIGRQQRENKQVEAPKPKIENLRGQLKVAAERNTSFNMQITQKVAKETKEALIEQTKTRNNIDQIQQEDESR